MCLTIMYLGISMIYTEVSLMLVGDQLKKVHVTVTTCGTEDNSINVPEICGGKFTLLLTYSIQLRRFQICTYVCVYLCM